MALIRKRKSQNRQRLGKFFEFISEDTTQQIITKNTDAVSNTKDLVDHLKSKDISDSIHNQENNNCDQETTE
ncbi:hypothetical protein K6V42_07120 [Streptococcus suis]|uniref:Uncharacterized protein n=1 Tax=Streptococcus suis D12 TaxID=1004952 RepID=G7SHV6_STRSU|nr:hypothetical protein [Streptococcus suis]AGF87611.1 hypothetical protein phiD12_0017 [Streptococcus phage phiD12]AER19444.1 hypothetical protein SSUD12_1146 [Streptococcus suis D12]MBY4981994.1 hypothetical protein [Streptococcus suis]MBY4992740.1 hypothetical protein [Streptococcus suis]MBY5008146.1 hypothetical protein [Streptococcus suis]